LCEKIAFSKEREDKDDEDEADEELDQGIFPDNGVDAGSGPGGVPHRPASISRRWYVS